MIWARPAAGRSYAWIAHTRMGIPAEEQDRLFERFYRTKAANDHAVPDTGLGLSISKAIVEAHGGSVAVASREDVGTTFRIELPLEHDGVPQ